MMAESEETYLTYQEMEDQFTEMLVYLDPRKTVEEARRLAKISLGIVFDEDTEDLKRWMAEQGIEMPPETPQN